MSNWKMNFGFVEFWNEEEFENETVSLNIEYNEEEDLSYKLERQSSVGRSILSSGELTVILINSPNGNVEICDEIYTLSDDQLNQLKSIAPDWEFEEKNQLPSNHLMRMANGVIHLGLVYHYNTSRHEFVLSDLEINIEEKSLIIKEYDTTSMLVTSYCRHDSVEWECSFIELKNDYQMYRVCGEAFLFNDVQATHMDCL